LAHPPDGGQSSSSTSSSTVFQGSIATPTDGG
jgi:hypothetical protein